MGYDITWWLIIHSGLIFAGIAVVLLITILVLDYRWNRKGKK